MALLLACDDDESGSNGNVDSGGDVSDVAVGDTTGDVADAGVDVAPETGDDTAGGDAADVEPEVEERACGELASQDETVTYDVLSPLAEFVGDAEVVKAGLAVTVTINDPEAAEPTVFEGEFTDGTRCVAATYENLNANLCFFDPDGSEAAPETLGAFLYAFIAGGPTDTPNATLLGAVRRDVDMSCTPAGWFELDDSDLSVTAGELTGVEAEVRERVLSYLAIFEDGSGGADIAMGSPPTIEAVDTFDIDGTFETVVPLLLIVDTEGGEVDYEVDVELTGSIDLETGELTAEAVVDVAGGDPEITGTLSGTLTGTRR